MKPYIVETFAGGGEQPFYWRIKARNGKVLVASEGYVTAWSARRTARRIARGLGVELRGDEVSIAVTSTDPEDEVT